MLPLLMIALRVIGARSDSAVDWLERLEFLNVWCMACVERPHLAALVHGMEMSAGYQIIDPVKSLHDDGGGTAPSIAPNSSPTTTRMDALVAIVRYGSPCPRPATLATFREAAIAGTPRVSTALDPNTLAVHALVICNRASPLLPASFDALPETVFHPAPASFGDRTATKTAVDAALQRRLAGAAVDRDRFRPRSWALHFQMNGTAASDDDGLHAFAAAALAGGPRRAPYLHDGFIFKRAAGHGGAGTRIVFGRRQAVELAVRLKAEARAGGRRHHLVQELMTSPHLFGPGRRAATLRVWAAVLDAAPGRLRALYAPVYAVFGTSAFPSPAAIETLQGLPLSAQNQQARAYRHNFIINGLVQREVPNYRRGLHAQSATALFRGRAWAPYVRARAKNQTRMVVRTLHDAPPDWGAAATDVPAADARGGTAQLLSFLCLDFMLADEGQGGAIEPLFLEANTNCLINFHGAPYRAAAKAALQAVGVAEEILSMRARGEGGVSLEELGVLADGTDVWEVL